jgi:hypothetical protein
MFALEVIAEENHSLRLINAKNYYLEMTANLKEDMYSEIYGEKYGEIGEIEKGGKDRKL